MPTHPLPCFQDVHEVAAALPTTKKGERGELQKLRQAVVVLMSVPSRKRATGLRHVAAVWEVPAYEKREVEKIRPSVTIVSGILHSVALATNQPTAVQTKTLD